jgi:cysteinyl-tRNA synthetase
MRVVDISRRLARAEAALPPQHEPSAGDDVDELARFVADYLKNPDAYASADRAWFDAELIERFDTPSDPWVSDLLARQ